MEWKGVYFALKPGRAEEYAWRHQNVPPELLATLKRAGICNYTIWNIEDKLFACYQVADAEKADAVLAACPVFKKWRDEMESIVYVAPVTGQKEWPMQMMFLME